MNSVNRSEMIYRVQREPTMASFWTAAPTEQPFVPLSVPVYVCVRAFSLSFTLPATTTAAVVPVSRNKSVQMMRYIAVGGWDAARRNTDAPGLRDSSALTDGQDTLPSPRRSTLRRIYAVPREWSRRPSKTWDKDDQARV